MIRTRRVLPTLLLALVCLACGTERRDPRPTVVLVSIDTLRADHVGCYGYTRDTTPFLDRFAREGLLFEHAFTPCPWTLTAHMTMLTGLFPEQHGVVRDGLGLADDVPLLAERLHGAGYQTVGLYFRGWVHERHGFGRGFDSFRPHLDASEAGAHLAEELARLDPERPLFLFVHLFDVHNGYLNSGGAEVIYPSPPPYQDMFLDASCEPLALSFAEAQELWERNGALTPGQLRSLVAYYDGGIREVDARLEQWFAELDGEGWLDGALVVVTADHGEALKQRGQLEGHGGLAQEGVHVPLIVRSPNGAGAGTRVSTAVHLGDIVPTVLAAVGLPADARLPGRSLLGPLPPERVITGSYADRGAYALRWPLKLVNEGEHCIALDLERDPAELHPRREKQDLFRSLFEQAWSREVRFSPAKEIDEASAEEQAELRALGYGR